MLSIVMEHTVLRLVACLLCLSAQACRGEGRAGVPDAGDDGCQVAARLIYAVDSNRAFYRFDPEAEQFVPVGTIDCGNGSGPISMSVTRDAIAHVLFEDGSLYAVSTEDATCSSTPFEGGIAGFDTFGMGYVTDGPDTFDETLYVAGESMLGVVDDWSLSPLAFLSGRPELTGNSLGELWGFFPDDSPPHVSRIDKETGELDETEHLPELSGGPLAWAFAHWGGDFYIFYQSATEGSTSVYLLDGRDGELEMIMPSTGKRIVGAGVSTCAPAYIE
jgi:hypothetical protein